MSPEHTAPTAGWRWIVNRAFGRYVRESEFVLKADRQRALSQ